MNIHTARFSDGHEATRRSRNLRYSHAWRFSFTKLGREMGGVGFTGTRQQAERELAKRRAAVIGVVVICDEVVEITVKGGRA